VAIKLGIFDVLNTNSLTASEVAERVKADERGIAILLEVLEIFGYVDRKSGDRYSNSAMTSKWVMRTSPTGLADFMCWWDYLVYRFWDEHLEESVRDGKPSINIWEWLSQEPSKWRFPQVAFSSLARLSADEMVAKVKLPQNSRKLLDVGGMHGIDSIKFCQKYPHLSATVFDLPPALELARKNIAAEGVGDRVSVRPGDYFKDDLGNGYDVALLFQILHGHLPDKNIELLRKVANALNPGGLVVIQDTLARKTRSRTARATLVWLDLTYLVTLGGQIYSFNEIAGWLTQAGLNNPREVRMKFGTPFNVIVATKTS
jgi:SAM-dependent methyltransferase